ncbi:hypothetical protein GE061_014737 [Apolygus lucorum]|uniref:Uncharacterized protein n=1 Tax=Apolygus lucorum TaxID=248454 RepID=A0A8S9XK97_APOLU|nr:hypothetical protein GE061_014737 [Apolygus lucorum]
MRFLVSFVTLLSITTCLAWNLPEQVQDTPEVAAAKAAHLAALAKAKEKTREKAKYSQDSTSKKDKYPLKKGDTKESWKNSWEKDGAWDAVGDSGSQNEDDGSWKGDESWKNYDDGSWMEEKTTTEKPKHEGSWDNARWTGPVALPPGYDEFGAPLPVEDTPEVADAKAKHMLLYAKAVSRGHAEPLQPSPIALKSQTSEAHRSRQPPSNNAIYVAPGKPAVRLPSGRSAPPPQHPAPVWETNDEVQDTPEVAAAKAAHYAAHARKRANA